MSPPQINNFLEILEKFFARKIVLAASQQYPYKKSKDFFTCRILLAANQQKPGSIQRLFRLQNCLSRKSTISWKNSETFSPADLS